MATSMIQRMFKQGTKIVCVGRNYAAHAKELGNAVPKEPVIFLKPTSSYLENGGTIEIPHPLDSLHHEVELALVIGQKARDVPESIAMDYIGGYAVALDMTARELQASAKASGLPWTLAKGQDTFTPISSVLPKAMVHDPDNLELWLKVDGETRQKGGKDGNSTKLKKTKKIHFDPLGTPEPNYKILNDSDQQFQTSSAAKGGKGDKPTKSSKNSLQSIELKDLPENAECMMDCEAFQILDGIKGHLVGLSEDPSIKIPVSYDRAVAYVETCVHYSNPQSVRKVLEPLKTYGISDGEMCVIANACPESVDEVFAFVPALKAKKEVINQPLQDALVELSKLKKSG